MKLRTSLLGLILFISVQIAAASEIKTEIYPLPLSTNKAKPVPFKLRVLDPVFGMYMSSCEHHMKHAPDIKLFADNPLTLRLTLDKSGRVLDAAITRKSHLPAADETALKYVKGYQYMPLPASAPSKCTFSIRFTKDAQVFMNRIG